MPQCQYFSIYPAWCSLNFDDLWFGVCPPHFLKTPSHFYFNCFFTFPLLLVVPLHVCYFLGNFPTVLEYSFLSFLFFYLFTFKIFKFIDISSSFVIVSSTMFNLLVSPFILFLQCFDFMVLAFLLKLFIYLVFSSLCLHYPCSHMMSICSITAFSILVVVNVNFIMIFKFPSYLSLGLILALTLQIGVLSN